MKTINVTDRAALHINAMRENAFGTSTVQKDNLLSAMSSAIRLAEFMDEDDDLYAWTEDMENIKSVLCDYWELRNNIEQTED